MAAIFSMAAASSTTRAASAADTNAGSNSAAMLVIEFRSPASDSHIAVSELVFVSYHPRYDGNKPFEGRGVANQRCQHRLTKAEVST